MGENPIIMAPASRSGQGQTEVGDAGQDIDKMEGQGSQDID